MAISHVTTKLYDGIEAKASKKAPSANGFDVLVNKKVEEKGRDREVCVACVHSHDTVEKASDGEKAVETSDSAATEGVTQNKPADSVEIEENVARSSAAYRFSIFIRTTSDVSSFGQTIADRFVDATRGFVQALHRDSSSGINLFDSYMGSANKAVSKGESQTVSFIDQMMQAADQGLKAVTASMNSASMLGGLNLSMNSALPGTSAADIAGIYLQDAVRTGSISSSGSATVKSVKTSGLQLIRSEDLLTAQPALSSAQQSSPAVKNNILEYFLQMLEGMTHSHGIGNRPENTEIQLKLEVDGRGVNLNQSDVIEKMPDSEEAEDVEITA
ncbi:MAG: hypothetical protein ACOYXC_11205 [Candidatus Rifleibacteriota bacterium]